MPRKNNKARAVTTQSEATKLLKKLGAESRADKRSGIEVTGELKEALRQPIDKRTKSAIKVTAETAAREADEFLDKMVARTYRLNDKVTQKQAHEFSAKYTKHLEDLDKAVKRGRSSLQIINRLEDLANYNMAVHQILKNPTAYFEDRRYATISAVMNNLLGTYKRDIPKDDLAKLLKLGNKLGLNTTAEMDRAWAEWDNLLKNSDQFGQVLLDARDKLKAKIQSDESFTVKNKEAFEAYTELAEKYDLW